MYQLVKKMKNLQLILKSREELKLLYEYDTTLTDEDREQILEILKLEDISSAIGTGIIATLFVLGFVLIFVCEV